MDCLTVSELAARLGCRPRDISDAFYARILSHERCPIVGGRRLIPESYTRQIVMALQRRGVDLKPTAHATEPK